MTSFRLLLVCSLCVLLYPAAGAAETNERTKNIQSAVDKLLLMQYAMQSNVNSLLSYVRGVQTAISLENQQKWKWDSWKAEAGVKQGSKSAHHAYHGAKFVEESARAVHESVKQLVEVLKETFEKTPETAPKEESAATWWGYALGNVSAQLTAAEKLFKLIEPAKEKMDVVTNLMQKNRKWEAMPEPIKNALADALSALEEPRKQTDELSVIVFNARVTLQSAQELTRGVRLQELQNTQEEKSREKKLQMVETLKEELEKKTVDGVKTDGTLELDKVQPVVETEKNTAANEAGTGVSQDALPLDGGLPATFHSAALFVSFVLVTAAAAMTAA